MAEKRVMWSFYYFDEGINDALNDYRVQVTQKKAKEYAVRDFPYPYTLVKVTLEGLSKRKRRS
jgi:hypothetical protein